MEHNDNEQQTNLDAYQLSGKPLHREDAGVTDGSATFVPAVLARLGLSSTVPSPTQSEELVLEALNNPAWSERLAAVQQRETLAGHTQLAALLQALRDEHENVRAAAARTLGMLASQEPVEPLIGA